MMLYVPHELLKNHHIQMLEKSLAAAPLFERPSLDTVLRKLREKDCLLFEVPRGVILAEVHEGGGERRLTVTAFYCERFGAHARGIIQSMIRLADDWKCTKIETCVYNRALLGVLKKLGGRVESVNMVMNLEPCHGQQKDLNDNTKQHTNQRSS